MGALGFLGGLFGLAVHTVADQVDNKRIENDPAVNKLNEMIKKKDTTPEEELRDIRAYHNEIWKKIMK